MKRLTVRQIIAGFAIAAMAAGAVVPAMAQDASGTAAATAANPAAASSAKPSKADRKAARKKARAKKNAELKKLEDAGYKPSSNDPNYPTDLQNAQKKAGIGQGASQ
ncbi:hypothetical protein A6V36_08405 [Paraburkholderia ginsengiterrae]|uniref:DUF4148 domain-containing protein n=1 Tax=Paraburkholderia ginsengiterrae TaxID=1462993 RepID=A0A1A9N8Q1_9BURK|nr:DUF4148 domain-containing protein [Paraburkholderia ginsengiterrae]OAJ54854.1 hypothetical protein A6V36_08405 [Paraburkholderia ginsengiterrae]OAJ61041.1 hypothetical protein A6V37_02740 [Paraburkholderia ginsengiterrae]